ncbi:MAG: hypothetical protein P4L86_03725 [Mycobacterium sp.]|nr:hypothetical protein [Mycobacterium sp.]
MGIDDPAEQQRLNDSSPVVIAARRKLAQFEAGQPVQCSKPSLRDFPAAAGIGWLAERTSGVAQIEVSADDAIRRLAGYGAGGGGGGIPGTGGLNVGCPPI